MQANLFYPWTIIHLLNYRSVVLDKRPSLTFHDDWSLFRSLRQMRRLSRLLLNTMVYDSKIDEDTTKSSNIVCSTLSRRTNSVRLHFRFKS